MLERLGTTVVRYRVLVLALTVAAIGAAFVLGVGVFSRLSSGGFDDPGAQAAKAAAVLQDRFGVAAPDLVVLAKAPAGSTVDDPAAATAGKALAARLAAESGVSDVTSYWTTGAPGLRGTDGAAAMITARVTAADPSAAQERAGELAREYSGADGPLAVGVAGTGPVFDTVSTTIEHDLAKAESIAVPLTIVLLVLVFGTMVASGLPMVIALVSVAGSFLTLFLLTLVTDVSVFSINLVTSLALGLGIDYSLFIVTRYREEMRRGWTPHEAVVRSVQTAGRTVLFSGLTVAAALSALLVFPQFFLRSFAYAGIATTSLAVVSAVVALPALLAVLGTRVDSFTVLRRSVVPAEHGFWYRLSQSVMRRPWPYLLGAVTFLAVLGLPFFRAEFSQTDDRVLPAAAPVAVASNDLRALFDDRAALQVVAPDAPAGTAGSELAGYAQALSRVAGVVRVDSAAGAFAGGRLVSPPGAAEARFAAADRGRGTWLEVQGDVEPYSARGQEFVHDVRAVPSPYPGTVVGGATAVFADSQQALRDRLPWALGIIVLSTFVLLFLFTGSVVIPVKALLLNLLSLSATFGALVWIFQEGHLQWLVGDFQVTGALDTAMPILMFCIAFGLSMDYEVFLLSRIKEEYDRTGDNTAAVATGLQRTGRLVTAAAALLAIVFLAFATSGVTIIKMMGIGVALAVIVDATVVRGLLVPAFMRLAGDWNWWAPRPLRQLHARVGLREQALAHEYPAGLAAEPDPAVVP